jgi:hypothetical protein
MKLASTREALVSLGLIAGLFACGSSFDDYCSKKTSCLGGNDKDKQVCVDAEEGKKNEASDYGCSSQYQDYTTCRNSAATCNGSQFYVTGCGAQQNAYDGCVTAASKVQH